MGLEYKFLPNEKNMESHKQPITFETVKKVRTYSYYLSNSALKSKSKR